MTRLATIAAALLAIIPAAAVAKEPEPHVYGPAPTWESYRAVAEAAVRARLVDPDSAKISWPSGYSKGVFKPVLEARVAGYVACGTVNARNRMGGYAGSESFIIVVDYDRALHLEVGDGPADRTNIHCADALRLGIFPPIDRIRVAAGDAVPVTSPTGLTLRAMPDGAYVSAVAPGSAAQTAGLKPGMVISSVNGIALAGMGESMTRVVEAGTGEVTLGIIGGADLKLTPGAKP